MLNGQDNRKLTLIYIYIYIRYILPMHHTPPSGVGSGFEVGAKPLPPNDPSQWPGPSSKPWPPDWQARSVAAAPSGWPDSARAAANGGGGKPQRGSSAHASSEEAWRLLETLSFGT